jgi:hypothetical protein
MAEWWLLDEPTQRRIAAHLDDAAERVMQHFDDHRDENSLTAALCQEIIREPILSNDTTVIFNYRNFAEQSEEHQVGADGGIRITIRNGDEEVEKGVLFQAKRLPQDRKTRSLSIPDKKEAGRFKRQISSMLDWTEESIMLGHTRRGIYAVEAVSLENHTVEELRYPFKDVRLVTIGTYLGKWVARCSRGDTNTVLIRRIREDRGFINHLLEMDIKTRQRPLLTESGSPVNLNDLRPDQIPQPRWRMRR